MIVSASHRIPPVANMNITRALLDKASSNQSDLRTTAAKVICCTVLPFLAIALFEAIVINSFRIIIHSVTVLKNTLCSRLERAATTVLPNRTSGQESLNRQKGLFCTEEQRATILEIAKTVAETSEIGLAFKSYDLYQRKKPKIDSVHPLKFLSVIVQHDQNEPVKTARYLPKIFSSSMKKWTFMGDLSSNLNRELNNGTFQCYFDDFARSVNAPAERLQPLVNNRNWQPFVEALM